MSQIKKTVKQMLVLLLSTLAALLLALLGVLLVYSPGKPALFLDAEGKQLPGSISEKVFVPIGGVRQGMFIRSKNVDNPVLLYVHGGPAFPNYFLVDKYDPGLEDFFTVCYWEQRGGGLSYSPEVTPQSMNLDQLASDAIEVTNYLRKRFGKEKIFMIAHSGGTSLALLAASRNPELFEAYIAMAQITNQKESEKIAYRYMLDQYARLGNKKRIKELEAYRILESDANIAPFFKSKVRDQSMHELGIGTMHEMKSIFWDVFVPVWTCTAYTLPEKVNIWRSKFSFLPKTQLINELLETDFAAKAPELAIPVYFFSGQYDLTVNRELSKAYLTALQAPLKGFYTFEHSAHSPLFEETLRARQIIEKDILAGKAELVDSHGF